MRSGLVHLCALWCLVSLHSGAAVAQNAVFSGQAKLDELYKRVLRNPTNVRLTIQYAQLAKDYGDYEAAIGAYERLLLFNPELADVQFELGVLYFQLESYSAARGYFEGVASSRTVSADVRAQASTYIKEIDRRLSPRRFVGFLHTGLRHQSNANAGSSAGLIRYGGQDVVLDTAFAKRPDWNAFAQTTLNYEQDIGNRGDTLEAVFGGYYARQFNIHEVNLGAAELQVGPRLVFLPEYFSNTTTKFYGIVNGVFLGDNPYFRTFGAGASLRSKINPVTVAELSVEYRDRKFYDSTSYPTSSQQTGDLVTVSYAASGLIYGQVRWLARLSYDWNSSVFNFWSYQRPSLELGMPISFDFNLFGAKQSGLITPYIGGNLTDFQAPDPTYDASVTRRDRAWYLGTTLEGSLVGSANFRLNVNYLSNESNIINFAYRNLSVSFGPAFRF